MARGACGRAGVGLGVDPGPGGGDGALDVPADWVLVAYLCLGLPRDETDTPTLQAAGWEHRQVRAPLRR